MRINSSEAVNDKLNSIKTHIYVPPMNDIYAYKIQKFNKRRRSICFFICLSHCLTPPPTLCLSVSQPFSYPPLSQYFFLAPCLSNSPSPSACLCNINSFSLSRSVCIPVSHSLCSCFYLVLCYSFSFFNNLTYPYITSTEELLKYTV